MPTRTLDVKTLATGWLVLLFVWMGVSYLLRVPEYLLASPHRVAVYFVENASSLAENSAVSGGQALLGAVAGIAFGIILGGLCFAYTWARRIVWGPMIAIQVTPVVAIAPLVTFWLGYGFLAKSTVAALVACYPVMIATASGLAEVKPNHVWLVQLAGATWRQEFMTLRLRAAMAAVLPSVRVSLTLSMVGSVVADFMAGNSGLGFLVLRSIYQSQGATLVAAVICTALLGQALLIIGELVTRPFEHARLESIRR